MAIRKTKEQFILEAIEIHGDKYDYSQVVYTTNDKPVQIYCKKHKEFFPQTPRDHLKGGNCNRCIREAQTKTKEQFILESIKIHGNNFDYSYVNYVNTDTPVKIYCKKHDRFFSPTPYRHLKGGKCRLCATDKLKKKLTKTKEQFVSDAVTVHGDKYDYSHVNYVNALTPVKIYCIKHNHFFSKKPVHHLEGRKCKFCGFEDYKKKLTEQFVLEAVKVHGDKYDYSHVNYVNINTPVKIYCKKHGGFFSSTLSNHLRHRCKFCVTHEVKKKFTKSKEQFVSEAVKVHGNKYDYSHVNYVNAYTSVKIYCIKHNHFFSPSPSNHLRGTGCPRCNASKGEEKIRKHLESLGLKENKDFFSEFTTKKDRVDFVIPKYKLLIEHNGEQHYKPISFGSKEKNAAEKKLKINIKSDHYKIQRSLKAKNNCRLLLIGYWDLERIPEIINDAIADKEPTFSEPPAAVKKYENKRMEIRRKLGIEGPEILCGLIRPITKKRSRKLTRPTQPL